GSEDENLEEQRADEGDGRQRVQSLDNQIGHVYPGHGRIATQQSNRWPEKSITSNQEIFMQDRRSTLPVLFALGFRPLFLLGALFAVVAIPLWIAAFLGHADFSPSGGWLNWHRHEMIFGFGVAIVAGFLLTAIQAWTGVPALSGVPVLGLALLWLAGRLCWLFGAPLWLLIPVDLIFLPLVALAVGRSLWQVRQSRNYPVLVMLLLLALCNLLAL